MSQDRTYICIDLKSFYASVECRERGLDPLTTNLVVADHIGILEEESYKRTLWSHRPLTDFWRVGSGIARRLESAGIYTMEDIAKADEDMLYRMFGIDAELLIDHAWGRETTTIADIKAYRPKENSISSSQVLGCDYDFEGGRLIAKEMADLLCLELVEKGLVTDPISLYVGYSRRLQKKSAHGTITMPVTTSSAKKDHGLYPRIIRARSSTGMRQSTE